jgi:hypothetical protein
MKIKFSKSQWEGIGKKAGWVKESQVQAPTKSPTKSPTKTPTTTPTKEPDKRTPFNPPRPKVTPQPKAKKLLKNETVDLLEPTLAGNIDNMVKLSKTYEEGVLAPVRDFWMDIPKEHPFSQNSILSEYGHNLSQEGYDYIIKKMQEGKETEPKNAIGALGEVSQLIRQIIQLEANYSDELIDEAKNITCQIWGIDKSQLNGILGQAEEGGGGGEEQEQEEQEEQEVEINPVLRSEINKRILMNTLTQGSALHAMQSVHHLVSEKINKISPNLLKLYTRLSNIVTHHYYIIDIPAVVNAMRNNLKQAGIGWSHVEFEEGQPKVVAQGICFPVLCQELFKGVMELLSLHGINQNLSEQELKSVYRQADRLEDEPWLITVGTALWRKFISVLPRDINLSEIIMKFSQEAPQKVDKIIRSVIQNPNIAKTYFAKYKEPEETYKDPEPTGEEELL